MIIKMMMIVMSPCNAPHIRAGQCSHTGWRSECPRQYCKHDNNIFKLLFNETSSQDSLKVLEAFLVPPFLAHLLGDLHYGVVALLPQPRVAPRVDFLPVLYILYWLKCKNNVKCNCHGCGAVLGLSMKSI